MSVFATQAINTTLASGDQTASGIQIASYGQMCGVYIGDTFSGSYIQARVSMDGQTWSKLATGGGWWSAQVSAGAWNTFDLESHLAYPFVRFEATATAPSADVDLSAYVRPL